MADVVEFMIKSYELTRFYAPSWTQHLQDCSFSTSAKIAQWEQKNPHPFSKHIYGLLCLYIPLLADVITIHEESQSKEVSSHS